MPFTLLLEDDHLQIKLLTGLLKHQLGLHVVATDSLQHALTLAQDKPKLIISDISLKKPSEMNGLLNRDGILFSQAIKSDPQISGIPLILRSSMPLIYFGTNLLHTKADIFLDKSTSNTELLSVVKQLVNPEGHHPVLAA